LDKCISVAFGWKLEGKNDPKKFRPKWSFVKSIPDVAVFVEEVVIAVAGTLVIFCKNDTFLKKSSPLKTSPYVIKDLDLINEIII
jgi:hypothetical protein